MNILKHDTLDTFIAVGDFSQKHNHVEVFKLSKSKWQIKQDYPYSKIIYHCSPVAVEKNLFFSEEVLGQGRYLQIKTLKIMKIFRKQNSRVTVTLLLFSI